MNLGQHIRDAKVLIVGDAMLDRYWFGSVDRISPEAPVPVVRVSREEERLGGAANVALNKEMMSLYPFCRLSAPANVLIMPALHTAHVSSHLLQELGDGVTIGPVTIGLSRPAQIVQMNASVSEILNMAALAALGAVSEQQHKVAPIKGKKKA